MNSPNVWLQASWGYVVWRIWRILNVVSQEVEFQNANGKELVWLQVFIGILLFGIPRGFLTAKRGYL